MQDLDAANPVDRGITRRVARERIASERTSKLLCSYLGRKADTKLARRRARFGGANKTIEVDKDNDAEDDEGDEDHQEDENEDSDDVNAARLC